VVDAVDGSASPPPELRLAWACEKWSCLPDAGAYLDQDYQLMNRMTVFSNVYNVYSRYRSMQGAQIHSLSDGERKILRFLKDAGVLFNG
jgi:ABC-type phosphate/phosphonate transport system ATPase subunit